MQPLLVIHRGENADGDDEIGPVLLRPDRQRDAVDMFVPQAAAHHVAALLQREAIRLDMLAQQLRLIRSVALQISQQHVADSWRQRGDISMTGRRFRDGNPRAGGRFQTHRVVSTRVLQVDHVEAIRHHEADCARHALGDFAQAHADRIAEFEAARHRCRERHRARPDPVLLILRQVDEVAHAGQRMGQARHCGARKPAPAGDFQIAEPCFMAVETAQNIEGTGDDLNDIIIGARCTTGRPLGHQTFGATSHLFPTLLSARCFNRRRSRVHPIGDLMVRHYSLLRNKIPLARQTSSGIAREQQEAAHG